MLHSLRILLLLKEFIFFFSLLIRHPHGLGLLEGRKVEGPEGAWQRDGSKWKVLEIEGTRVVVSFGG